MYHIIYIFNKQKKPQKPYTFCQIQSTHVHTGFANRCEVTLYYIPIIQGCWPKKEHWSELIHLNCIEVEPTETHTLIEKLEVEHL